MDLHGLEYIVEIARVHNLSRAAENLFITQSTLSQHLSKVEQEIGVPLFERKRNEMSLTHAGLLYVEVCKKMLLEKRDLYNQLSDIDNAKTGQFSVGITPQWGAVAFSHIIEKFIESYPDVSVKVNEEVASPLTRMLQIGIIDMAIIPLANDTAIPQNGILLQAEELLLAIPKSHIKNLDIAHQDNPEDLPYIRIEKLQNEPMIFSSPQTTIRKLQSQCFSSRHVEPKIILEINSHPASLNMVESNIGTTFVPTSCATPSAEIFYAHAVPLVQWYVTIAFRKGFALNQSSRYFVSLIRDYFNHLSVKPQENLLLK